MMNLKDMMMNKYEEVSYTNNYILGYPLNGNIYMNITSDRTVLDMTTTLDKASRGAGYSIRFAPKKAIKKVLAERAICLCSKDYFEHIVEVSKYNKGEIFEQLVSEYFGIAWEKDNVPFTKGGDIEVNGVAYQIKFERATFTNERTLHNLTI